MEIFFSMLTFSLVSSSLRTLISDSSDSIFKFEITSFSCSSLRLCSFCDFKIFLSWSNRVLTDFISAFNFCFNKKKVYYFFRDLPNQNSAYKILTIVSCSWILSSRTCWSFIWSLSAFIFASFLWRN